jgi:hypothetical protein
LRFRAISKKHEGWLVAAWQDPAIGKKGESFFAGLLGYIKYREERPFSFRRKPNAEDLPDQGSQAQTRVVSPRRFAPATRSQQYLINKTNCLRAGNIVQRSSWRVSRVRYEPGGHTRRRAIPQHQKARFKRAGQIVSDFFLVASGYPTKPPPIRFFG